MTAAPPDAERMFDSYSELSHFPAGDCDILFLESY